MAIASNGRDTLYAADTSGIVYKYGFDQFGSFLDATITSNFVNISGLFAETENANSRLFVQDDLTAGNNVGQGRVWKVEPI